MIEKLRRTKRCCSIIGLLIALLLFAMAVTTSGDMSAIAAFSLIAVLLVTGMIEKSIDSRINRLLEEENRNKPVINTPATVVSSRIWHKYWTYGGHKATIRSTPYWYVTFRTLKHGDVELNVPHDVFLASQKGRCGNLRYQGWRFIAFR